MPVSSISRRSFIRATTGAVAIAATNKAAESTRAPFKLRYVLSTSLYGTLPIADILPEVHSTGSEALDIWAGRWGNQREQIDALGHEAFAELLKKHRTKVGTYTCMDPGFAKSEPHMRAMLKFGGDMIIAGFGGGGAASKNLSGDELRRGIRAQVRALKPIIARAGELNVKLAIENHLGGLLASPDALKILVEEIPEQHVGVAFAPYHLPQDPEMLGRLAGDLGERILYFYAWQHGDGSGDIPSDAQRKQLPGVGPLDFKPMLAALKRNRFNGWTSIFMHASPRGASLAPTPTGVSAHLNQSRDYIERTLATV